MSKMRKYIKDEKTIKWFKRGYEIYILIVDAIILIITNISPFISQQVNQSIRVRIFLIVTAVLVTIFKIIFIFRQILDSSHYHCIRKKEELSVATLNALKKTNESKHRSILQSTYGRVPQWHPTDYIRNVLVYDVHEQIRSILSCLQKEIIDICEMLSEDQVTVDFVYCYPKQNAYTGKLPAQNQTDAKEKEWRLITSGNHSLGGSIHSFLANPNSFFSHVDEKGYCFYNDKMVCIKNGNYIVSNKDKERNRNGSIVGLKIELKNDEPETVFVKGILTITTYGGKLYEKEPFPLDQYEEIFKDNVLNIYKSLLLSELAQMYIRHEILEGNMCPKTGELADEKTNKDGKETTRVCIWTGRKCKFCIPKCCFCDYLR